MISDLYTLCNTVNRYVLRIVTINMIFYRNFRQFDIINYEENLKKKMLWT
jgi:hypothetical protein